MPPRRILGLGGMVAHVHNRSIRGAQIFRTSEDYAAFERVLARGLLLKAMRLLAYCVMPNHWHLILWPKKDDDLPRFMHWLTLTHTHRWHFSHGSSGTGPIYQGRYRLHPIETGTSLLRVCRYVERNPLRAGLVSRAEQWQWSSLWKFCNSCDAVTLTPWPVLRPANWIEMVNQADMPAELTELRNALRRGQPIGSQEWADAVAARLGLTASVKPRGRPRKQNSS